MRVLINRKQYRWFSIPTIAYQMQWVHINQCVRNAFEVSKPRFLGHRTTHGPLAITHGGRMGLKDRCDGKLFGRSETTSSLPRTYGTNMHLFFFCCANVTRGARDFFPRWVKIETCQFNWWDEVRQHLQWCIASHHLQWCIDV